MRDFKDKVAVVTGGASGVGRCIADILAGEGAKVVICDINAEALEKTKAEFAEQGKTVDARQVDVTSAASVDALAEGVFADYGNVHLLFNNAGVGIKEAQRRIWTLPTKDWEWAFAVNVHGVTNGIRAFVPTMLDKGEEGHVVNTTSGNGGLYSLPTTPVYASTKAAVTSLTEVLHFQFLMDESKLQAHLLYPGPYLVNTNILNSDLIRPDSFKEEGAGPATYVDMEALAKNAGLEFKLTEPEEVAEMCIEGVKTGEFWILSREGTSDEKFRTRSESILGRTNPVLPS